LWRALSRASSPRTAPCDRKKVAAANAPAVIDLKGLRNIGVLPRLSCCLRRFPYCFTGEFWRSRGRKPTGFVQGQRRRRGGRSLTDRRQAALVRFVIA